MTGGKISHTSFVIERDLPGSARHAYRFFAERDLKQRWISCHPDWSVPEEIFDFRVGGLEATRWRTPEGIEIAFQAVYLDIVPGERIVYAYTMGGAGRRESASLVTVEFRPKGSGTLMVFTEQAAFMGADEGAMRRAGTEIGFERLAAVVEQALSPAH